MAQELYRLYIDESGDHTYGAVDDPAKRYLGLTGCFIEADYYRHVLHPAFERLKQRHFPHSPDEPIVLHRRDLLDKTGPYWRLRDSSVNAAFEDDLIDFLETHDYRLISIVIDKAAHGRRYGRVAYHPYHYCLALIMERYCGFLKRFNAVGDVMAESRGKAEDRQLAGAYSLLFNVGTRFHPAPFFASVLTTRELKLKPKRANVSGLQVADLLAHECKQSILIECAGVSVSQGLFGRRVSEAIKSKYNCHYPDGRIEGYGRRFLG